MKTKTTISISEARKRIFDIAEEVQKPDNYYTFTERGRPKAVLMSARDFEEILEDLEILSNPNILKRVQKSEEEFKRGEYITLEDFKKELGGETKNKFKKSLRRGRKTK